MSKEMKLPIKSIELDADKFHGNTKLKTLLKKVRKAGFKVQVSIEAHPNTKNDKERV